jgi:hypothetical protein
MILRESLANHPFCVCTSVCLMPSSCFTLTPVPCPVHARPMSVHARRVSCVPPFPQATPGLGVAVDGFPACRTGEGMIHIQSSAHSFAEVFFSPFFHLTYSISVYCLFPSPDSGTTRSNGFSSVTPYPFRDSPSPPFITQQDRTIVMLQSCHPPALTLKATSAQTSAQPKLKPTQ